MKGSNPITPCAATKKPYPGSAKHRCWSRSWWPLPHLFAPPRPDPNSTRRPCEKGICIPKNTFWENEKRTRNPNTKRWMGQFQSWDISKCSKMNKEKHHTFNEWWFSKEKQWLLYQVKFQQQGLEGVSWKVWNVVEPNSLVSLIQQQDLVFIQKNAGTLKMGGPLIINPNINLIYTLYRRYPPWN